MCLISRPLHCLATAGKQFFLTKQHIASDRKVDAATVNPPGRCVSLDDILAPSRDIVQ
jgi:hypothetical protein